MIYGILGFYVIPMILAMLITYFDEDTETVGDFLRYWWAFIIPIINLATTLGGIFAIIYNFTKFNKRWQNFKNIKLKK